MLIESHGGAHKIICPIQISMLNKKLMSDFKYGIALIALESGKVAEWILK